MILCWINSDLTKPSAKRNALLNGVLVLLVGAAYFFGFARGYSRGYDVGKERTTDNVVEFLMKHATIEVHNKRADADVSDGIKKELQK